MSERNGSLDFGSETLMFSLEELSDGKPASIEMTPMWFSLLNRERTLIVSMKLVWPMEGETVGSLVFVQYDAHYYGAFLYDPDGNKNEAVTFMSK